MLVMDVVRCMPRVLITISDVTYVYLVILYMTVFFVRHQDSTLNSTILQDTIELLYFTHTLVSLAQPWDC